jgi:hypothetical protein
MTFVENTTISQVKVEDDILAQVLKPTQQYVTFANTSTFKLRIAKSPFSKRAIGFV